MARERIKRKRGAQADKIHAKKYGTRYEVGDLVLVKSCNLSSASDNQIAKFLALYEGPYHIIEKKRPSTFVLRDITSQKLRRLFHVNNLKRYFKDVDKRTEAATEKETGEADPPGPTTVVIMAPWAVKTNPHH